MTATVADDNRVPPRRPFRRHLRQADGGKDVDRAKIGDVSSSNSICVIGAATIKGDREPKDPAALLDAVALMSRAVSGAAERSGSAELVASIDWIGVPEGTWAEVDAAAAIASELGIARGTTVRADVGVTQDQLLAEAARAVCNGSARVAVVVGGEARHRQRLMSAVGLDPTEVLRCPDATPDLWLKPSDLAIDDLELIRDTVTPAVSFALMESTIRHHAGRSIDAHDQFLDTVQSALCGVAASNPSAWNPAALSPSDVGASRRIADPYVRAMVSDWTVDLASAVVLVSESTADEIAIPAENRCYLLSTAWSNHSVPVPARRDLHRSLAVDAVADQLRQAAAANGSNLVDESTVFELYSCFPASLQLWANAFGVGADESQTVDVATAARRWTVTGGMAAAGGPLNNSAIQGWVGLWDAMRSNDANCLAVSTSVSGSFTKHGGTLWSSSPGAGWNETDLSDVVRHRFGAFDIDPALDGSVVVVAHTIDRRGPRFVAICERDEQRTIAQSTDAALIESIAGRDLVGKTVTIDKHGTVLTID